MYLPFCSALHCFFFQRPVGQDSLIPQNITLIYKPSFVPLWSYFLVPNWRQSNRAGFHKKDVLTFLFSNAHHYSSLSLVFGIVVEQKYFFHEWFYLNRIKAIKYLRKAVHRNLSAFRCCMDILSILEVLAVLLCFLCHSLLLLCCNYCFYVSVI